MTVKVSKIITDIQELVGEVSGAGTQTYSEDILLGHTRRGFNIVFTKWPWAQYRGYFQGTVNGVTGKLSTAAILAGVKAFEDVIAVYLDGQTVPLATLPKGINPYSVTGTTTRYYTSLPFSDVDFASKLLQFWPLTSTNIVNVVARLHPARDDDDWVPDLEIDLDRDLLGFAGAFMTLSADDINPGGAEVYRVLMENRFKSITASLAAQPIPIEGGAGVPTDWFVAP